MKKYMKISKYAKLQGVGYRTIWNHYHKGLLSGKQLETGTILIEIDNEEEIIRHSRVATYARVSSSENKSNLESQSKRLLDYANAKGYNVVKAVKEIGSGLNDNRQKLYVLLDDDKIDIILVEHKDRFSRFGLNYIKLLLEKSGRKLEIINEAIDDEEDLIQDFVSIVTSFCVRLYGKRRSKRKTEKLIRELKND